jgi:predicted nucleic acid-binding protein
LNVSTENQLLLDASVLIALFDAGHVHHDRCSAWLAAFSGKVATCAITELAILRWALRVQPVSGRAVGLAFLKTLGTRAMFLNEGPQPALIGWDGIIGHNQVTDAYLVALAHAHRMKLITLDRGLLASHGESVVAVP